MTAATFIVPLIALALIAAPLIPVYKGVVTGKAARRSIIFNICAFFGFTILAVVFPIGDILVMAATGDAATATSTAEAAVAAISTGGGIGLLGAGLSTGFSSLGAGVAVSSAASAAIGAVSEDPKALGKSLIFVALGEGIALYGLLISILIINKI
jgi:V/A-type H+-transporting ATPase subunit K